MYRPMSKVRLGRPGELHHQQYRQYLYTLSIISEKFDSDTKSSQ